MNGVGRPKVACYTFPHYHRAAFNERLYGPGWTEYVLARGARPRFPGHHQPRQPLLGELDERDPRTWDVYASLLRRSGVDAVIWDAYWYDEQPVLHEALEEGFLGSAPARQMEFAVMWTNGPWWVPFTTTHPHAEPTWTEVTAGEDQTDEDIWRSISYLICRYLHAPNYLHVGGLPFLAVYDARRLVRRLGPGGVAALFDDLRGFARRLGHAGLHLHAGHASLDVFDSVEAMGFDSYGLYSPVLLAGLDRPASDGLTPAYANVAADVAKQLWPAMDAKSPLPFVPAVSTGWDSSPRYAVSSTSQARRTKGSMVVVDETPEAFETLCRAAFQFLDERPTYPQLVTIGCLNEWTEGQYLLPDTRLGFGMLEALGRAVYGATPQLPFRLDEQN